MKRNMNHAYCVFVFKKKICHEKCLKDRISYDSKINSMKVILTFIQAF